MDPEVSPLHSQFFMIRCSDKNTAEKVRPTRPAELIFYDGDGEEYYRRNVADKNGVMAAFKKALELYSDKDVSWASGSITEILETARKQEVPVVLSFLDDKKNSQKYLGALKNRWLVKHHEDFIFVRAPFDKDSALCKEWNVRSAPTVFAVNPVEEDAKKRIIEKFQKKDVRSVRRFLLKSKKAFAKAIETR